MAELRIGKVSSIDYDHGMIRVVYTDRDKAVTKPLPVLTFNDEYKTRALEQRDGGRLRYGYFLERGKRARPEREGSV